MSHFTAAMSRGVDRIYKGVGESAFYIFANGSRTDCVVIPERDLKTSGEFAQVNAALVLCSVRKSEIPERPKRGETIVLPGSCEEYAVREVIFSDQFEWRFYAV